MLVYDQGEAGQKKNGRGPRSPRCAIGGEKRDTPEVKVERK